MNPPNIAQNPMDYKVFGIDLGIRNWAASDRREYVLDENADHGGGHGNIIKETNILHKGRDFHFNTGLRERESKRKKVTGNFDRTLREALEEFGADKPSCKSRNIDLYVRTQLKYFKAGTAVYYDHRVVCQNFDKYTRTQTQMSKVAKEIVGPDDGIRKIGFIGACTTPSDSTIKGHQRLPGKQRLMTYLKQRKNVQLFEQDEFRTTKLCSWCYKELEYVESSKDRLKKCQFCKAADDSCQASIVYTYRPRYSIEHQLNQEFPDPIQYQGPDERRANVQHPHQRITENDRRRIERHIELQRATYTIDPIVPPNSKRIRFVNRDTNACRNIIYRGLCKLGLRNENIAFSRNENGRS